MNSGVLSFFAGIGLLFAGVNFLTLHLRMLLTKKVQEITKKFAGNDFLSALWGAITKAIMQESSVLSFIIASFVTCGVITLRQAVPMLTWSNLGGSLIVYIAAIRIDYFAFLLIGITGIGIFFCKDKTLNHFMHAIFGLCILLLGMSLIKSSISLENQPWLTPYLEAFNKYPSASFFLASLLTVLTQSSVAILVLTVNFANLELVTIDNSFLMIYGIHLGTIFRTWIMAAFFDETIKRVMMSQVIFNAVLLMICLPLYFIEKYGHIPLLKAAVTSIGHHPGTYVANLFFLINLITCFVFTFFYQQYTNLLFKLWPISTVESYSYLKFLTTMKDLDTFSVLKMAENEIEELHSRLDIYLESLRSSYTNNQPTIDYDTFHQSYELVSNRIYEVLYDLTEHPDASDFNHQINRQLEILDKLNGIEGAVYSLSDVKLGKNISDNSKLYFLNIIESIDFIWNQTIQAINTEDREDIELVHKLTSDKGEVLKNIRASYIREIINLDTATVTKMLHVTGQFEKIIWLIRKYLDVCIHVI